MTQLSQGGGGGNTIYSIPNSLLSELNNGVVWTMRQSHESVAVVMVVHYQFIAPQDGRDDHY